MIWGAVLLVAAMAGFGVWAFYILRRQHAATTDAGQWRVLRLATIVSFGVGVEILVLGFAGFLMAGHDWVVLAVTWSVGLFHLGMLALRLRMARRRTGKAGVAS